MCKNNFVRWSCGHDGDQIQVDFCIYMGRIHQLGGDPTFSTSDLRYWENYNGCLKNLEKEYRDERRKCLVCEKQDISLFVYLLSTFLFITHAPSPSFLRLVASLYLRSQNKPDQPFLVGISARLALLIPKPQLTLSSYFSDSILVDVDTVLTAAADLTTTTPTITC